MVIIGILGVLYGAYIIYKGTALTESKSEFIIEALKNTGMTNQDGMYAFIGFGSTIIVLYVLLIGLGILGMISSNALLKKSNIFWISLVLGSFAGLLGIIHIIGWVLASVTILICIAFCIGAYEKFNNDLKYLNMKNS